MSAHLLHITGEPKRTYKVKCVGICTHYVECDQQHAVDGVSAGNGPYQPADDFPEDQDEPWSGYDDFPFHGELHTWDDSFGWCIYPKRCPVNEVELPEEAAGLAAGTYKITAYYQNDQSYLKIGAAVTP